MCEKEAIHNFFGLTYSNYLVLPRSALQSMPDKWQKKFVNLLNKMSETIVDNFEPPGGYRISALDEKKKFIHDPFANYDKGRRKLETKN